MDAGRDQSVATVSTEVGTPGAGKRRQMVRAELLGQHTHESLTGVRVHIFRRDGQYLARARYQKAFFGETLGSDAREASARLRHLLTELDNGSFLRPSEARRRVLKSKVIPKLDLHELCDAFLTEKRKLRGKRTAATYLSRLVPALEFADRPTSRQRWPLAQDLDRDFAIELRAFLMTYAVTRNGRPGATPKTMSARQVHNVLTCLQGVLAWARQPGVRKLPNDFDNPFSPEIVGRRPDKDPLRPVKLPVERRVGLVEAMDLWSLSHLGLLLVLPIRPEEVCGLLISDVDFDHGQLSFATRFEGKDFTKGRQSFRVPFPPELLPLLQLCRGERVEGPLLQTRAVFEGRKRPKTLVASTADVQTCFQQALCKVGRGAIMTEQDAKVLFRRALRTMGGASPDELEKAFKGLVAAFAWGKDVRMYDLRSAVTTDMNRSGMSLLELRYMTGHTTRDILNAYVSLDLEGAMAQYFEKIQPLLTAIGERTKLLMSNATGPSCSISQ